MVGLGLYFRNKDSAPTGHSGSKTPVTPSPVTPSGSTGATGSANIDSNIYFSFDTYPIFHPNYKFAHLSVRKIMINNNLKNYLCPSSYDINSMKFKLNPSSALMYDSGDGFKFVNMNDDKTIEFSVVENSKTIYLDTASNNIKTLQFKNIGNTMNYIGVTTLIDPSYAEISVCSMVFPTQATSFTTLNMPPVIPNLFIDSFNSDVLSYLSFSQNVFSLSNLCKTVINNQTIYDPNTIFEIDLATNLIIKNGKYISYDGVNISNTQTLEYPYNTSFRYDINNDNIRNNIYYVVEDTTNIEPPYFNNACIFTTNYRQRKFGITYNPKDTILKQISRMNGSTKEYLNILTIGNSDYLTFTTQNKRIFFVLEGPVRLLLTYKNNSYKYMSIDNNSYMISYTNDITNSSRNIIKYEPQKFTDWNNSTRSYLELFTTTIAGNPNQRILKWNSNESNALNGIVIE